MREEDTEAWLRAARKEHWAPPPQGGVKMSEVSLRRAREREVQLFPLQGPSPGTRHFNGEEAGPTAPVPPCPPDPGRPLLAASSPANQFQQERNKTITVSTTLPGVAGPLLFIIPN